MPQVSVIIPTYRRPEFLRKAIASVLTQTFRDFEVIVVDDASNDDTSEVVRSITDTRIRYIPHETNKGGGATRNTGIRNAHGEYIAFLDDDDEWLPEKLELQIKVLANSPPEVGGVYSGYQKIERTTGELIGSHVPTKKGNLANVLLDYNWVGSTSSVLLRKECVEKVGLFDESLPSLQDYDLWIRISRDFHFAFVSKPLVIYYIHNNKISTNPEAFRQGLEIMMSKLGNSSSTLRKNYWYRFIRLGVLYCLNGETKKGRKAYYKAIRLYPLHVKPYLILCLTLLGTDVFRKVMDGRKKRAVTLASKMSTP